MSVVSINLCTDQLTLLLAESQQIVSLSHLSHQKAGSYYHLQARDYPVNQGHAEQVLALKPDLVLAGPYTSVHTLSQLRELGLRVETIPVANSVDAMLHNIETVAALLAQSAKGRSILRNLRARLARLQPPQRSRPLAAVYDPNGYTAGGNTLRGQMMELAGWDNVATLAGIDSYGTLALETLVRLSPDALIDSPYSSGTWSRGQNLTRHPAIHEAGLDPYMIDIPSRETICAGPWTIDIIEQLQQERIKLMGSQ